MERERLPFRTFVRTDIGDARENWYKTEKKPKLDKMAPEIKAPENFVIADVNAFISGITKLVAKNGNLGVYFGTETARKPDVVLLFAAVEKWSNLPGAYYLLNKKGELETIDVEKAHTLRNNYQNGVQEVLHDSTGDGHAETEYIYFGKDVIAEILEEFRFQADKGRIDGLKVRLVSYADKKIEGTLLRNRPTPEYLQRLSVLFTYMKDGGDTSFEEIDPERYERTLAAQEGILGGGLNSGNPIPPPPPQTDTK